MQLIRNLWTDRVRRVKCATKKFQSTYWLHSLTPLTINNKLSDCFLKHWIKCKWIRLHNLIWHEFIPQRQKIEICWFATDHRLSANELWWTKISTRAKAESALDGAPIRTITAIIKCNQLAPLTSFYHLVANFYLSQSPSVTNGDFWNWIEAPRVKESESNLEWAIVMRIVNFTSLSTQCSHHKSAIIN